MYDTLLLYASAGKSRTNLTLLVLVAHCAVRRYTKQNATNFLNSSYVPDNSVKSLTYGFVPCRT